MSIQFVYRLDLCLNPVIRRLGENARLTIVKLRVARYLIRRIIKSRKWLEIQPVNTANEGTPRSLARPEIVDSVNVLGNIPFFSNWFDWLIESYYPHMATHAGMAYDERPYLVLPFASGCYSVLSCWLCYLTLGSIVRPSCLLVKCTIRHPRRPYRSVRRRWSVDGWQTPRNKSVRICSSLMPKGVMTSGRKAQQLIPQILHVLAVLDNRLLLTSIYERNRG